MCVLLVSWTQKDLYIYTFYKGIYKYALSLEREHS